MLIINGRILSIKTISDAIHTAVVNYLIENKINLMKFHSKAPDAKEKENAAFKLLAGESKDVGVKRAQDYLLHFSKIYADAQSNDSKHSTYNDGEGEKILIRQLIKDLSSMTGILNSSTDLRKTLAFSLSHLLGIQNQVLINMTNYSKKNVAGANRYSNFAPHLPYWTAVCEEAELALKNPGKPVELQVTTFSKTNN